MSSYKIELDGRVFETADPILSGRDIRSIGGLSPASDFVLIEIGDATSRSVGLEEPITLQEGQIGQFRSFRSDRSYSLTINERGFEWGAEDISASDIRKYGAIPEDHDLILDSDRDRPIGDDDVVRLKPAGVERITSIVAPKVQIFVNTREHFVPKGRQTFWDIVRLAFPEAQPQVNTAYTVSYRKGPGDRPEGTLIAGESVRVKKGMLFNVSETDKS
ncbi:multiubiquitin domain-containing protein [Rhizobium sp. CSW-27]|uniref:multiubiquitin domain-containing protein n=1 Tax=Rhizobium sp. CSW-27 TaxID=2839985 RepID=UPI001C034A67|nr:multiubiquitin domain-containing protein [Rhizobium sp. CSW-27]MBT9373164.1 multiubiquitin domain-containing protein [Rhizobium sp. CSW-27]